MSKLDKILNKFRQKPPEVNFSEVVYVLQAYGFEEKRIKGSHHSFRNGEGLKITIPKKGGQKVKGIYVQKLLKLLELEEN